MNEHQRLLANESVGKLILKYSLPAIIGMLVNGLYNVVDRMFIGNIPGVGHLAISGLGVTLPIMTIIMAFGVLIGIGSATNISIKLGEGKQEQAQKILGTAILLNLTLGIVLSIIGLVFVDSILMIFGASPDSLPFAKEYIIIILIGATFNITAMSLTNLMRSDGRPKLSATIMATGCFINIILDALFIFGFGLGIAGAALATVISQFITATWALLYFFKGKSNVPFFKKNLRLRKEQVLPILAIGAAPFIMQVAMSGVQIICNNSLKIYGGDMAIGAFATISSIMLMTGTPIIGLAQGSQPIVGFNFGAKQYHRANKALKINVTFAGIYLLAGMIMIQLIPEVLVNPFSGDNPELVAMTVTGLKRYTIVLPLLGPSMLGTQYIQAIGKAKLAMVLSLMRQVLLLIPLMIIMPRLFGLTGIWFAQPIADTITFFVTTYFVLREIRAQNQLSVDKQLIPVA
ncbi:MAG: MATE family efflux transporter [Candidatus Epulonipiscioides saccharophilum]|nr:MAG: MATE family efflux transporter [Epulopiscium sp. AS2M-Bin001]